MKKSLMFIVCLLLVAQTAFTQQKAWNETEEQRMERLQWWTDARFGMFIHWGLYAQLARGEWVKTNEQMTNEEYQKYFELFNPDLYDPVEWAKAAKMAGMKYVVITTKHHEGFCLWDSEFTDYKATNTPYGKDLLKPFVKAFRDEGLGVGFYYSLIDWHHPEFTIDIIHPMRDNQEMRKTNKDRDLDKYAEYMRNQLHELMTGFGKVDFLWADYCYPGPDGKSGEDYHAQEIWKMVRELQPEIILNDRLIKEDLISEWGRHWDFRSPEQTIPAEWLSMDGKKVPWETCETINGSWGYSRDDQTSSRHGWKTDRQLIKSIIEVVSKGGNLLLNVGPTGRGAFDDLTMDRLRAIGHWMDYHSRSIYGCTAAPEGFITPDNCLLTYNTEKNRMYVHILEWPIGKLHLEGFAGKVKYAQLLNDASEIRVSGKQGAWDWVWAGEEVLTLDLPVIAPDVEIPVIELILK